MAFFSLLQLLLSLQSLSLDVKVQLFEFGEGTKSTAGNLTFKSKYAFKKQKKKKKLASSMKIEPAVQVILVAVK